MGITPIRLNPAVLCCLVIYIPHVLPTYYVMLSLLQVVAILGVHSVSLAVRGLQSGCYHLTEHV